MASAAIKSHVSPEEYLALERKAEFKSEYFDGCIYAMAGASAEHGFLALDLATVLNAQLRAGPCEVFSSDMRVLTHRSGLYTYPDLLASGWLGSVLRPQGHHSGHRRELLGAEYRPQPPTAHEPNLENQKRLAIVPSHPGVMIQIPRIKSDVP
jgi:hypothetical protein